MREVILINISGEDKPGLTSSLTKILSNYNIHILDIGQSVIHDFLSLGILIEVPEESESSPVLKDLLFKAHELGIRVRFNPITEVEYENWVSLQGKDRHIITLLGKKLHASQISKITKVVSNNGLNIDIIFRLSGRVSLITPEKNPRACVEISVRGKPKNTGLMREEFLSISRELGIDIAFQEDNLFRRNRRLVAFDMDSTLIQTEVLDELAKAAGVEAEVKAITESAMNGELDFKESFTKRVAMLKGLEESVMQSIAENLPLTEGAEKLCRTLKTLGYKIAILSGGITFFGRYLQQKLDIDHVFANELEIENGRLTGNYKGEIIDGQKKADLLKTISEIEKIDLRQTIAVGDGANDLPMIKAAGLGIAFHAKPIVKENAGQSISTMGLDGLLYLIGIRDRDIMVQG